MSKNAKIRIWKLIIMFIETVVKSTKTNVIITSQVKHFDICQFWPLLNISSVQLSYFANKLVA